MFWSKDRTQEQQAQAKKLQEDAERNKQIQNTMKQLQSQIVERAKEVAALKQELERARAGEKEAATSRNRLQEMQHEMAEMRKKMEEAQAAVETQKDDDVSDLEEIPADQQRGLQSLAKQELAEALKRIGDLHASVKTVEEEDAPTPRQVGSNAWVRRAGGKSLNRRDAPGLHSNVLDALAIGTQVTMLEGPHPADNYTWWRVRASDGREGWVAGEELVNQPE